MTTETQTTAQNDTDAAATGDSGAVDTAAETTAVDQTTTEAETSTEGTATAEAETDAEGETDEAEAEQGAPEDGYQEFTMPEGYTLDEKAHEAFLDTAKELNLSQEAAQALIDYDAKRVQSQTEAAEAAWNDQVAEWQSTVQNDEEMGKGNYESSMALANKAVDAFGGPELRNFLDESGLGNHPDLIRAFYKAGKAIGEDRLVSGDDGNNAGGASTFYKNSDMN